MAVTPHRPAAAGTPPATPPAPAAPVPTASTRNEKKWLILGIFLAVLFGLFIKFIFFNNSSKPEKFVTENNKGRQVNTSSTSAKYSYTKVITFGEDYKDSEVPSGLMVSVLSATGPYCIQGDDESQTECSVGTEDITSSDKFRSDNKKIYFKSKKGNDTCTLLLRSKY